jgi:hypothetical protein
MQHAAVLRDDIKIYSEELPTKCPIIDIRGRVVLDQPLRSTVFLVWDLELKTRFAVKNGRIALLGKYHKPKERCVSSAPIRQRQSFRRMQTL